MALNNFKINALSNELKVDVWDFSFEKFMLKPEYWQAFVANFLIKSNLVFHHKCAKTLSTLSTFVFVIDCEDDVNLLVNTSNPEHEHNDKSFDKDDLVNSEKDGGT